MIDLAEEFIVFDMFLFNAEHQGEQNYPKITRKLTESLINKKEQNPEIEITFITDQINTVYGSYEPEHLQTLRAAGVDVVLTNLSTYSQNSPSSSALVVGGR
ncbi:hypothetical protein H1D32_12445 [Anaerobacillus sp. CMMVII]|uniref:hypothetical protein n=1 Tax=Anaerobacillus sp. CMMVII TaxID=2755588 RepID=UPI0021B8243E|nr:hypothetical protein [Anaerobacillus sp. CMMVII]MCT8138477.1 hypothetical protein [Anaerobacillus sp. CMMVII]